jgi:glycosyltransferase involved in cell wall biosynthesis
MKFSVLICTCTRHELLRKALRTLIENAHEKPDQVVVVNGGDERADRVVKAFMGQCGIEVGLVKTVNKNLAASRNVGLPHCTGDIIAMTDDEVEILRITENPVAIPTSALNSGTDCMEQSMRL